ncbi:hypothetical protein EI94DRAFT_1696685 [Lactarius quietus]|nr:hypothetical protein EI94DRAFT_1696685 [Lactarius quietus]
MFATCTSNGHSYASNKSSNVDDGFGSSNRHGSNDYGSSYTDSYINGNKSLNTRGIYARSNDCNVTADSDNYGSSNNGIYASSDNNSYGSPTPTDRLITIRTSQEAISTTPDRQITKLAGHLAQADRQNWLDKGVGFATQKTGLNLVGRQDHTKEVRRDPLGSLEVWRILKGLKSDVYRNHSSLRDYFVMASLIKGFPGNAQRLAGFKSKGMQNEYW